MFQRYQIPYRSLRIVLPILFVFSATVSVRGQDSTTVVASGLAAPLGLTIDAQGNLWVAEQGTAETGGRISIVTPDGQVYPFLQGLPLDTLPEGPSGLNHLYFDEQGRLLLLQGEGIDTLSASVLFADTSAYRPGDPPRGTEAILDTVNIGAFSLGQGAETTNPYTLTEGPDSALYIVDAGANAVMRYNQENEELSVFARFDSLPNPTPVGEAFVEAVPTRIVRAGDRFYVSTLTGFPFLDSLAAVYEVDMEGNVSVYQDNLTLLVDLAVDPRDGALVALQHGLFRLQAGGFQPNSGAVLRLNEGQVDTLVSGLNLPTGLAFAGDGTLFVTTLAEGEVIRIPASTSTAIEDEALPEAFHLKQNYPNPFNPSTLISYVLKTPGYVTLTIYDVLGRKVRTLVNGEQPVGTSSVIWNGRNDAGEVVSSGVYLYKMNASGQVQVRSMLLVN